MASYTISIPHPCNQDWDQMTPVGTAGKHCASCNKVVIDFTGKSEKEILEILLHNTSACGRIESKKLNKPIQYFKPVRGTKYHWPSVAAFIVAGMFSVIPSFSQTPQKKLYDKNLAIPRYVEDKSSDEGNFPKQVNTAKNLLEQIPASFIIKGKVIFDSPSYWIMEDDSVGPKPPASGAKIQVWKGDRKIIEVESDQNGEFQVKLSNKWLNKWLDITVIHQHADEKVVFHKFNTDDLKKTLVIELDRQEFIIGFLATTPTNSGFGIGMGGTYYGHDLLMLFPGW